MPTLNQIQSTTCYNSCGWTETMEIDRQGSGAARIIETLKYTIDKIEKERSQLQKALDLTRTYIESEHLGVVIALYSNGALYKLLCNTLDIGGKDSKRNIETVQEIFQLAYECLLCFDQGFLKIYRDFKFKKSEFPKYTSFLPQSQHQNFETQKRLVKTFNKLKENKTMESYEKGVKLRDFIKQELSPLSGQNTLGEVTLTWLKKSVFELMIQIFKEKAYSYGGLCCHLHFENDLPQQLDASNQFHISIKDRQIVKKKDKNSEEKTIVEVDTIRKNIAYYLNNAGGFLFIGVLTKSKHGKVQGISGVPMTKQDRLEFLKAFSREVTTKIFPTDGENQYEDDKQQEHRITKFIQDKDEEFKQAVTQTLKFQMSSSIFIEFLPLYQRETLTYSRDPQGEQLFVISIKVKCGNPAEVYYTVNQKQLPEAFTESPQKPLLMIDYYNLVYEKLKDQANGKLPAKQPHSHPLCIHNLRYEPPVKGQMDDD